MWTVVRYLHLVAMAAFLGGQLLLAIAVAPVVRRAALDEAMRDAARRFGMVSAVALAVLIATGAAMASHFERWEDSTLQLKLGVLGLVLLLVGAHIARPKARGLSLALLTATLVIVWLGAKLAHG